MLKQNQSRLLSLLAVPTFAFMPLGGIPSSHGQESPKNIAKTESAESKQVSDPQNEEDEDDVKIDLETDLKPKVRFALVGLMDIDGDGDDDTDELLQKIAKAGGKVSARLGANGEQQGKMDTNTSFIVLGTDLLFAKNENALGEHANRERAEEYAQFLKKARNHGVIQISLPKLVGYIDEKPGASLSSKAKSKPKEIHWTKPDGDWQLGFKTVPVEDDDDLPKLLVEYYVRKTNALAADKTGTFTILLPPQYRHRERRRWSPKRHTRFEPKKFTVKKGKQPEALVFRELLHLDGIEQGTYTVRLSALANLGPAASRPNLLDTFDVLIYDGSQE